MMGISLMGCYDEPTCLGTETNIITINFYDYNTLEVKNIQSGTAAGADVNFPSVNTSTPSVKFPVNSASDTTIFNFTSADAINYTLTVRYTRSPMLINPLLDDPECGLEIKYSSLEAVSTNFDSLAVIQHSFNDKIPVNIEVYF